MTATSGGPLDRQQRLLAVGLVLGVTLVAFEVTSVATALPTISSQLHGDGWYGLALSAYTLANMVGVLLSGAAADRLGPAVPFLAGTAVFVVGLAVAAAAPDMAVHVAGRILQGLGNGGYAPIAYAVVARAFPPGRRPTMIAALSTAWVLPSLFAPLVAGWITQSFGWRWLFWAIIPLAVAVAAINAAPMHRLGAPPDSDRTDGGRQIALAVAGALGVGAVIGGLQQQHLAVAVPLIVVGGVVGAPAIRRLLPRGTLRASPGLPAALAARLLATGTFMAADGLLPLAAARIHHVSPARQGLLIVGAALTWSAAQWAASRRTDLPPGRSVRLGFVLLAIGTACVVPIVSDGWPLLAVFAGWGIAGAGMGWLFNPTSVTAMKYATDGTAGRLGSQLSLADALGFSLIGGVGGGLVALADHGALSLTSALVGSFAIGIVLALAGMSIAGRVRPPGAPTPAVPTGA